jgi:outer membrane PBP1 activator LpoA protein
MTRTILVLLLAGLLTACQSSAPSRTASERASTTSGAFAQQTSRSYDIQTREFQQEPPYGARANNAQ